MLIHRRLTRSEAIQLHEELKTTPNILGYTVREIEGFRDAFVAEVEGVFAGVCVSKDLLFGWTDIAVLYVLPAFRGRGLGTELYTAAWQRASQRSRHIFTLSRSPQVIHLMKRFGMDITGSMWRAPLAFHLHMNRHMMSLHRMREAIRKSTQMKSQGRMLSGTRKAPAQRKSEG
jgi:GNAT superfamily N-acetyltransferase